MKQYGALDDTMYYWFAANDTSGSGGDGASAAADVRLAGAAADAAPVYSPTPTLLSHANYPAGAYEIAITASSANGFATGNTYAVFCTLTIDAQNPTGFVGSFDLKPVEANTITIEGLDATTQINNQVVDVMKTDTTSEMSQGAPPATPTMEEMFAYVYFMFRNKNVETTSEHSIYDNAGTTKLFKCSMVDSVGTFTKGEYASGV